MSASSPYMQAWLPARSTSLHESYGSSPAVKAAASKHGRFGTDEESTPMLDGERLSARRRRRFEPCICVLVAIVLASTAVLALSPNQRRVVERTIKQYAAVAGRDDVVWPASSFGPLLRPLRSQQPAPHLFDNLLRDGEYLTTMSYGGQSNQVISIIHLLHLASLTGHIAILPSLVSPHHIDNAPAIPASHLFDLDHYRRQTGVLVAEWADLKAIDQHAPEFDHFGCHSLLQDMFGADHFSDPLVAYHHSAEPQLYPVMSEARRAATGGLTRGWNGDGGYLFESLVTWLEEPRIREAAVAEEYAYRLANVTAERRKASSVAVLPPIEEDERLVRPDPEHRFTCVDTLFFVQSGRPRGPDIELEYGVRGWAEGAEPLIDAGEDVSWAETGRHLRFRAPIESAVSATLRTLLDLGPGAAIPPFIGLHIRRGDFATTPGLGLASVETYVEALGQVRERLDASPRFQPPRPSPIHPSVPARPGWTAFDRTRMRARDLPVVVATDETDPRFLAELDDRGWIVVDHAQLQTVQRYDDPWMPSVLDQGVLSRAAGLVMTAHSTYSGLAGLRVRWWNGGQAVSAELADS